MGQPTVNQSIFGGAIVCAGGSPATIRTRAARKSPRIDPPELSRQPCEREAMVSGGPYSFGRVSPYAISTNLCYPALNTPNLHPRMPIAFWQETSAVPTAQSSGGAVCSSAPRQPRPCVLLCAGLEPQCVELISSQIAAGPQALVTLPQGQGPTRIQAKAAIDASSVVAE